MKNIFFNEGGIPIIFLRYNPDNFYINNEKINLNSPNDAILKGVSVVHQERNLIRRFSVGENLMLNNLPKNLFNLIDFKEVQKL